MLFFESINNDKYLNEIRNNIKYKCITSFNKQIQKKCNYCALYCIAFLHFCENNNPLRYKVFYDIVTNNRSLIKYVKSNFQIPSLF